MPLVVAAYLAFVGGVLGEMAGLGRAVGAAAAAAILLAVARRAPVAAALAALALSGALLARAETVRADDCRRDALGRGQWSVRLAGDARPGASLRGWMIAEGCELLVGLSVSEGEAASGATVSVRGLALPADGGVSLRIVRASISSPAPPGWLDRSRARARARVRDLFGADYALPAALLLADTEGLTPEVRQRFADAGLIHVLAISGLHIGLVAGAIELLARSLRVPRRSAAGVAAAGSLAYVWLLGFPPAALRSGAMLAAMAVARMRQRPTSAWAVLAVGAAIPLLTGVGVAASLGYQLSVIGVAALLAAGELGRRWRTLADRHGWSGALARAMLASTMATAVSAPIVAWHFGRLSLVGPLANIVASPVVAFLQPLLFLALALAPIDGAAALAADAARPVLRAFDAVAAGAAALPGASIAVAPTLVGVVCLGLAMTALLVACVATFPGRALVTAALSLAMAVWLPVARGGDGRLEIHLLDVGQGDAIAVRTPAGRWLLVDAGRVWRGGDAGRRTVLPYLRRRGGRLAAFILSHPHADHVGGAASVLARHAAGGVLGCRLSRGRGGLQPVARRGRPTGASGGAACTPRTRWSWTTWSSASSPPTRRGRRASPTPTRRAPWPSSASARSASCSPGTRRPSRRSGCSPATAPTRCAPTSSRSPTTAAGRARRPPSCAPSVRASPWYRWGWETTMVIRIRT